MNEIFFFSILATGIPIYTWFCLGFINKGKTVLCMFIVNTRRNALMQITKALNLFSSVLNGESFKIVRYFVLCVRLKVHFPPPPQFLKKIKIIKNIYFKTKHIKFQSGEILDTIKKPNSKVIEYLISCRKWDLQVRFLPLPNFLSQYVLKWLIAVGLLREANIVSDSRKIVTLTHPSLPSTSPPFEVYFIFSDRPILGQTEQINRLDIDIFYQEMQNLSSYLVIYLSENQEFLLFSCVAAMMLHNVVANGKVEKVAFLDRPGQFFNASMRLLKIKVSF
ncbi:hypothetical protein EGR_03904 [Echinococcus granulosus]|uniref:Uncharacterized protein n=1 Tax=Echinococcus granulosus TaxID=6210 RepID=W6V4U5_ECHGR|nr:hypothetical protein EGR_03904 [Echinococcus granulosus]EUB61229.1 hypothetical protein EGR_03904 [Echinococcus granulosus]